MNAEETAQDHREEVRRQVRAMLAGRPSTAHRASYVRHRINSDTGERYTDDEVDAAISFLQKAGQIEFEEESLGATKYWKITAAGILAHERGH
ncbi:MAG TPA: hypothetical protein PLU30_27235 [Verrucomicrobiae bacterium]|nr:hypothetical protein [Verrucomicrobiae bacterium]